MRVSAKSSPPCSISLVAIEIQRLAAPVKALQINNISAHIANRGTHNIDAALNVLVTQKLPIEPLRPPWHPSCWKRVANITVAP